MAEDDMPESTHPNPVFWEDNDKGTRSHKSQEGDFSSSIERIGTKRTPADVDRKYLKSKMRQFKKEHRRGNYPAARRHAQDVFEYFGVGNRNMPVEHLLEDQRNMLELALDNR